ncbi:MAG: SCO family protein, partial [Acidiferrobacterales bacterium]|nr:SCO family protein [Acidiferrobacterales bacterium]
ICFSISVLQASRGMAARTYESREGTVDQRNTHKQATKNRLILILLALVLVLPMGLAYVLYAVGWRPSSTGNHGDLVVPARVITDVRLRTRDDGEFLVKDVYGKWTFVYFGPAECVGECERSLYKMRQVRLAQGRHADRVERLFIVLGKQPADALARAVKDYPGMVVVTGSRENIAVLARQFALPAGTPLDGLGRIYLMDPAGRLMMSYPADADPSGMRKDLARLLKVSQIG